MSSNYADLDREELEARLAQLEKQEQPGGGGNSFTNSRSPVTQHQTDHEFVDDFTPRFNASSRGSAVRAGSGTAQITIQETERFVRATAGRHLLVNLARNSSKPAVRQAAREMLRQDGYSGNFE
jgi:hypothetical protein